MSPYLVALRSKYKVRGDWLHKDPIKNYSSTLRATERLKVLICKCACNIVGDDSKIDCWKDPWLPNFLPTMRGPFTCTNPLLVSNLI